MKLYFSFRIAVALLVIVSSAVHASSQMYTVRDGDTIKINIASDQLNRLAFEGSTQISKYWGAPGLIESDPDKENGELFFKPAKAAGKTFSFFLRDSHGATYTVIATQNEIPVQTILLRPKNVTASRADRARFKSNSHEKNISELIRAMDQGGDLPGYEVYTVDREVKVWKETDIKLVKQYEGFALIGDVYLVRNRTGESMTFAESEFSGFGDRVRATSIRSATIEPGEMTLVYVVREGETR